MVGVKQCHESERWRCVGKNDSKFDSVDSRLTREREKEPIQVDEKKLIVEKQVKLETSENYSYIMR